MRRFYIVSIGIVIQVGAVGLLIAGDPTPTTRPAAELITATQPSTRPAHGLAYHLSNGSEKWDAAAKARIIKAMDEAVAIYNANGDFNRTVTANYSPGTPTADANFGGWINFGGQIGTRTALHEIAHTLGVGTYRNWQRFVKDGKWTGEYALAQLREFDGPDAVLHADRQHFWPYGLNYDREGGVKNFKRHVKMVIALRRDMGLEPPLASTRPATVPITP
jgi:hypothetical protein